jgi:hypothetical protein
VKVRTLLLCWNPRDQGVSIGELGPILKGIGTAATNPLAFVVYIVAIGAWVFLRQRVDRNNNLLKRLAVLPKEDRLLF